MDSHILRFVATVKSTELTTMEDNKLIVNCLTTATTHADARIFKRLLKAFS